MRLFFFDLTPRWRLCLSPRKTLHLWKDNSHPAQKKSTTAHKHSHNYPAREGTNSVPNLPRFTPPSVAMTTDPTRPRQYLFGDGYLFSILSNQQRARFDRVRGQLWPREKVHHTKAGETSL
jgi:hypothetical protein